MKTQAAVVRSAAANFAIEEVDLADPAFGQVRVKMQACGICRSDLSALDPPTRRSTFKELPHSATKAN